jgi:hypothetical protein
VWLRRAVMWLLFDSKRGQGLFVTTAIIIYCDSARHKANKQRTNFFTRAPADRQKMINKHLRLWPPDVHIALSFVFAASASIY